MVSHIDVSNAQNDFSRGVGYVVNLPIPICNVQEGGGERIPLHRKSKHLLLAAMPYQLDHRLEAVRLKVRIIKDNIRVDVHPTFQMGGLHLLQWKDRLRKGTN